MVLSMGDFVYLKLQLYRQATLKKHHQHKLLPKFFFQRFKVLDRVGHIAYQLEIPTIVDIHPIFHVSQVKPCPNPSQTARVLFPTD